MAAVPGANPFDYVALHISADGWQVDILEYKATQ
jgi:hypothetical protein